MDFISYKNQQWQKLDHPPDIILDQICVTYKDQRYDDTLINVSSPLDIAKKNNIKNVVIAKIDGVLSDAWKNFETTCDLDLLTFDDDDGKHVFWHSSAHILGYALEKKYKCHVCVGPALDNGYYYDVKLPNDETISSDDIPEIESIMQDIVKNKYNFQKMNISKKDALVMFKHNPYKVYIIQKKVEDGAMCSVYKCGEFIDFCRGPHIPNTGMVKAMKITKMSSAYFGDNNDNVCRIYGVSFPNKKMMRKHLMMLEEAKKRNHKKIGLEQQLFFFHEHSPGSCFFLPHGAIIYRKLIDLIRDEYWKRGYSEVITPNIFKSDLWKTSGHWDKYSKNMFCIECEKEQYSLKPMNCPSHCLMIKQKRHSYKEFPIRLADFGALHRNELSGTLNGLIRVRRFCQDDAHLFCRRSQIKQEIEECMDFIRYIYNIFGFEFSLELSTRPDNYIGEIEIWDEAEKILGETINNFTKNWKINKGDGAFYGPKIDIHIKDALGRSHQCATIQLDFNMPQRFKLKYQNEKGEDEVPVMIHRAIFGSIERFFAILTEHYAGKWPFWLSPRQVKIIPIADKYLEYAKKVKDIIHKNKYYVDVNSNNNTLNKKIRNAQKEQYNYILVVGQRELDNDTISVRYRDNKNKKVVTINELLEEFKENIVKFK
uniref:threonine--tRNA ligase n=1 Tax=Mimivirus LCMiAC01 TaxID=2506608 RepID=A0A481Z0I2_9VIRU|nr:MAG: threonyl-tRNA synthetase [Mimivirus LCMiAC01]